MITKELHYDEEQADILGPQDGKILATVKRIKFLWKQGIDQRSENSYPVLCCVHIPGPFRDVRLLEGGRWGLGGAWERCNKTFLDIN